MAIDIEKVKREQLRWLLLETLNSARPIGANEGLILQKINPQSLVDVVALALDEADGV